MIKVRPNQLLLLLYTLFIIYGGLFPFVDWRLPSQSLMEVWMQMLGERVSRSDLLTNILAYIPLGFLISSVCSARFGNFSRILLTVILGSLLSFSMECLQMFLPARTSSSVDLLLNMISTFSGALSFSWVCGKSSLGEWCAKWRSKHFNDGKFTEIGLLVVALWGATQLAPFVPSIDIGDIKNGLKPLWLTLNDLSLFNVYRTVTYALNICALGSVLLLILRFKDRVLFWIALYCGIVLLGKIVITGRQLSLEAIVGLAAGILLTTVIRRLPKDGHILVGACSVAGAFIAEELRPDVLQTVAFREFNWIPFSGQMAENLSGIGAIIDGLWPFTAMGAFAVARVSLGRKIYASLIGIFFAVAVFVLEYTQSFIIGRYPDITPAILAVTGWSIPLIFYNQKLQSGQSRRSRIEK